MTVSEYIVKYLKACGVTHYFGYQGTMIAYFVDAIYREKGVYNHVSYNEQGAALAASGFTKATGNMAVAYATSGPGAINLLQGIADAYYDSAPVLFITGQINLSEYTFFPHLRQQGFQQTDIVSICSSITKNAIMVTSTAEVPNILDSLVTKMLSGRMGPALLDIPMDIQRAQIDIPIDLNKNPFSSVFQKTDCDDALKIAMAIFTALKKSKRPVLLLGNGISKNEVTRKNVRALINKLQIPVVTTLLAKDLIPFDSKYNFGMLGYAYGHRYANMIVNTKADLIISLGARLCPRQTGIKTTEFAKAAHIIRVDIDKEELNRRIHFDEMAYCSDVNTVIDEMVKINYILNSGEWLNVCNQIKNLLQTVDTGKDYRKPNEVIRMIGNALPEECTVACDVGQHQIWVAQSFENKKNQRILFSGAHGAMGFALPAAIGAYYGKHKIPVCIAGDGAFQMNIQELQWVVQEKIPIKIIILNNHSLGLIRQQQSTILAKHFYGSVAEYGYSAPAFCSVASAYGMRTIKCEGKEILSGEIHCQLRSLLQNESDSVLLEIELGIDTYAYPKTSFGGSMHDQNPPIPEKLLKKIMLL